MSGLKNALFLVVALGVVGAAAFFAWLKFATTPEEQRRGRNDMPVMVRVATVELDTFSDRIEALGTAQSNESVSITAKVTETVRKVRFSDGQTVEAGDILIELTNEEEDAELEQARASLRQAEQQFARISDLVERGSATRSRLDEAVSTRDQARARVRGIEARISDRLIRAPFSGILGLRQVSPGTLVTPGTVITTLDDIDPIKLDFSIPETFFTVVRTGQTLEAAADAYSGEIFNGEVTAVDTRIDPVTRSVMVRSQIPNSEMRLRPGMLMRVEIVKNERQSLMVPEDAIVPLDTRVFVFRVNEEAAVDRVQIQTGARKRGAVEVLSGLSEGDRVVSGGTNRVRQGAKVIISGETAEPTAPGPSEQAQE